MFMARHIILREVIVYESEHSPAKYGQRILPGYRKAIDITNGMFEYFPTFTDGVENILIEISEWW
jgi:hypothetical protein